MKKTQETIRTSDDDGMVKYAVDESVDQEQLEKHAASGCPWCGKKLARQGTVLLCPTHGTEPFETAQ